MKTCIPPRVQLKMVSAVAGFRALMTCADEGEKGENHEKLKEVTVPSTWES